MSLVHTPASFLLGILPRGSGRPWPGRPTPAPSTPPVLMDAFLPHRFTCPFVEKFSIDIETYYKSDAGENPNVFSLSPVERSQLVIGNVHHEAPVLGFPIRGPPVPPSPGRAGSRPAPVLGLEQAWEGAPGETGKASLAPFF